MTEELIEIIDRSNSTIDEFKYDYKSLAKHLGLETKYVSIHSIKDEIIRRIRDKLNFKGKNSIAVHNLGTVAKILVYKYLLFNESVLKYLNLLQILNELRDSSINRIPAFNQTVIWSEIITNVKNYELISDYSREITSTSVKEDYPQEFDRVIHLKNLLPLGIKIEIVNDDLEISNTEPAIYLLNKLIKKIGGIKLANYLFKTLLRPNYSHKFERYHITRVNSVAHIKQAPQIPFGYILNLCVKYPYENQSIKNITTKANEIISLSIDIISGYYNVQHYNGWVNFLQTGDSIIRFFSEIALWDSLYSIIQIRPSLSLKILEHLFEEIDEEKFTRIIGICKADVYAVLSAIIDFVHNRKGVHSFSLSTISKRINNIDNSIVERVLELNTHSKEPNDEYLFPSDYTKVDFQFNALIKKGKNSYILMDKSWCAPAFYESIATKFRSVEREFDTNMGPLLEKLIYKCLDEHNIIYHHGDYENSNDGECDILIETSKTIILIESKKKVLKRKARSGSDVDIFIDLLDSLLCSQIQASKTELVLRKKGEISFKNKIFNKTTLVEWKERNFERISLTHLDFGCFHDRNIITQFLEALLTHSYSTYSSEERIIRKFAELERKRDELAQQYIQLKELDNRYEHNPFFDSSFFNVGQLIELIELSSDNDSFYDNLTRNKFMRYGTLDFYKEFELALEL